LHTYPRLGSVPSPSSHCIGRKAGRHAGRQEGRQAVRNESRQAVKQVGREEDSYPFRQAAQGQIFE